MSFLLDTNICSAYLKSRPGLTHRFIQHAGQLHISTIVLAELYAWALQRHDPQPLLDYIEADLLSHLQVFDFDQACARKFGEVRGALLKSGRPIDRVDVMIASVALVHDLTLVTNNTRDFARVPGLTLVDWLQP